MMSDGIYGPSGRMLRFYFSYIFGNKPKSINLGTRIHAPNHVRITTPCSVHVPGRLNDGESLLKRGRTLTGGYLKPAISFLFSKHHLSGDSEGLEAPETRK